MEDSRDGEGYTRFVRSMPRPAPPACAYRGCEGLKLKYSPLFCAEHELCWIAHAGLPSHKLDSVDIGAAVQWAKRI